MLLLVVLEFASQTSFAQQAHCSAFLKAKTRPSLFRVKRLGLTLERIGYRYEMTLDQKTKILDGIREDSPRRRHVRNALETIGREDPNWKARRLAMDVLADVFLLPSIGYYSWERSTAGRRRPLKSKLRGFGGLSHRWFRAAIEITLFQTDADLGAKLILGRQSAIQWLEKKWQGVIKFSKISVIGIPSLNYWPSRKYFIGLLRTKTIDAMKDRYFEVWDKYREERLEDFQNGRSTPDFEPLPLTLDQLKGLLWITRNDPSSYVRDRAKGLLNAYYNFDGLNYLVKLTREHFDKPFEVMKEIRKIVGKEKKTQQEKALNPFSARFEIDEYIDRVQQVSISVTELNRRFTQFKELESEEHQMAFIAQIYKSKPTAVSTEGLESLGIAASSVSNKQAAPYFDAVMEFFSLAPSDKPFEGGTIQFLREVAHYHHNSKVRFAAVVVAKRLISSEKSKLSYNPL